MPPQRRPRTATEHDDRRSRAWELVATISAGKRARIPDAVLEGLGLQEGDRVLFEIIKGRAVMTPVMLPPVGVDLIPERGPSSAR